MTAPDARLQAALDRLSNLPKGREASKLSKRYLAVLADQCHIAGEMLASYSRFEQIASSVSYPRYDHSAVIAASDLGLVLGALSTAAQADPESAPRYISLARALGDDR